MKKIIIFIFSVVLLLVVAVNIYTYTHDHGWGIKGLKNYFIYRNTLGKIVDSDEPLRSVCGDIDSFEKKTFKGMAKAVAQCLDTSLHSPFVIGVRVARLEKGFKLVQLDQTDVFNITDEVIRCIEPEITRQPDTKLQTRVYNHSPYYEVLDIEFLKHSNHSTIFKTYPVCMSLHQDELIKNNEKVLRNNPYLVGADIREEKTYQGLFKCDKFLSPNEIKRTHIARLTEVVYKDTDHTPTCHLNFLTDIVEATDYSSCLCDALINVAKTSHFTISGEYLFGKKVVQKQKHTYVSWFARVIKDSVDIPMFYKIESQNTVKPQMFNE